MRLLLLGDLMVDVITRIDQPLAFASDTPAQIELRCGGAAANTASWLAHEGTAATLIGAVGDDELGALVRRVLGARGVHLAVHVAPDRHTGTCVVIVDESRERTMMPDPGANEALDVTSIDDEVWASARHLHVSGYTLLNPRTRAGGLMALRRAKSFGLTCSLDPASAAPLARDPGAFDEAWEHLDALLANAAEAVVLTGRSNPEQALDELTTRVPTAVVKLGPEGAIASSAGVTATAPSPEVDVVDTTGAGDAFSAGFLPRWLDDAPLRDALTEGCRLGALAVSRVGAGPD